METSSRLGAVWSRITDKLSDQVWFQQLKTKWEELDPQNRHNIQVGSIICTILIALFILLSAFWRVHSLKVEIAEKSDILRLIQSANNEVRKLRETAPGGAMGGKDGTPWPSFFESTASTAGVDKASMSVTPEKKADGTAQAAESMFDINLKHVNIKQVVRFSYYLENGARPVRIRNLLIDTKNDPTGYVDATLSISGFTIKQGS